MNVALCGLALDTSYFVFSHFIGINTYSIRALDTSKSRRQSLELNFFSIFWSIRFSPSASQNPFFNPACNFDASPAQLNSLLSKEGNLLQ